MPDQNSPWVSLSSAGLSAQIDPLGAQLSVLRDHAGRDLLWNGDPSVWAGRAPLLFPIVGALAATADALYFTSGAPNQTPHDLYRVPLAGGTRSKVLSSSGGVGDVVVAEKDVIVPDRPNSAWEIESLAGGDIAQITIVASDVGRQPHLLVSPGHVAWSTANGVSFAELER